MDGVERMDEALSRLESLLIDPERVVSRPVRPCVGLKIGTLLLRIKCPLPVKTRQIIKENLYKMLLAVLHKRV